MIEDDIGYIRLRDFNEKSSDSLISSLSDLERWWNEKANNRFKRKPRWFFK